MEAPGVGDMILNVLLGVPAQLWTMFVRDPGPWLIVAAMVAAFAVLGALSRRRRRSRQ
ncbi:hypothetical protein ACFPPE_19190 [Agromyces tardus]|uniref:hypothetical protein n=1 Tax=Agromyces tardus TaxID=2583849 RepID=UPI00148574C7|nr:hypothetical protein [Agromyces tardus]